MYMIKLYVTQLVINYLREKRVGMFIFSAFCTWLDVLNMVALSADYKTFVLSSSHFPTFWLLSDAV
jgi:hypothetical protein